MKIFFSKSKDRILISLFITLCSLLPLHSVESPKEKICELLKSSPYIGLAANEVTYGPITLKNVDFGNCGRVVFATPGETVHGSVEYKVDSDKMESLHLHHVIVGIKGQDHQDCITHSLGLWNQEGEANFALVAPSKKGVYEVRFDHEQALLCKDAIKAWQKDTPSSKATIGFIIVN